MAIFHERNMGIAKTINDGLEKARGKFIAFIASDDLWVKDKLEKQLKVLEKDENLIVWSEGEIIGKHGVPAGKLFTQKCEASRKKKNGDLFDELLKGNYIFGSSLIIKRENVEGIRFNENLKYLNDYQYVLEIARRYKYYFIEEPLAKYRIHGGNTITLGKGREDRLKDHIKISKYFQKVNPKVSIIILNWNGWKDTIECLESVYQITYPNYDVIVVDNSSENESIKKIKEYAEGKIKVESKFFEYNSSNKPIKIIEYTREESEAGGGREREIADLPANRKIILIKNEENYGFAEGNNIGMRYALKALNPDYVLLLNNDTVVNKEFLGELANIGERDERIGILGPKINSYYEPDVVMSAGFIYLIHERDNGQYDNSKEVSGVIGCALFIKKNVIEKVGMLDPVFFVYHEERDFEHRARNAGVKIYYVHTSKIWHKKIIANVAKPYVIYYGTRNIILFGFKNYSIARFIVRGIYSMLRLCLSDIKKRRLKNIPIRIDGIKDGILTILSLKKGGRNDKYT